MRTFNLGNGHTLEVENGDRGIKDDYKVTFKEDGRQLGNPEYMTKDCVEWVYDITL